MNFSELADLIDAFAEANEAFKAEHTADFQSPACVAAYEQKQTAIAVLEDAWDDALEGYPKELAAALRKANNKT